MGPTPFKQVIINEVYLLMLPFKRLYETERYWSSVSDLSFIIMNQYLLVCSSFKIAYSYYTVINPIIELQSVTFRSLVSTFLCHNANKYMLTLSVSYQQDSIRLNKPVFITASGSLLFDFVLIFLFFWKFLKVVSLQLKSHWCFHSTVFSV